MPRKYSSEELEKAIAKVECNMSIQLKSKQREAIETFVRGSDMFVSLPTGFGKSLCFVLLPLIYDTLHQKSNTSIVVCVSLMMEQSAKYSVQEITSAFVGELQDDLDTLKNVKTGNVQLLYISPESLLRNPQWRDMLLCSVYQDNLVAFVVAEAHCIAQW